MKISPTSQGPYKWLFTFLALFFFSFNSLQAQDYVSSDDARERLETEAVQLDDDLAQGDITQIDYTLKIKFLTSVLEDGLRNHDFKWSTANNAKIKAVYNDILQKAKTAALEANPQHADKINTIEEEIEALLKQ